MKWYFIFGTLSLSMTCFSQDFIDDPGLVLAYRFNENWIDTIFDLSENHVNGYNNQGIFTNGYMGCAIEFNEEDTAHIMVGSPQPANISHFTMWAWVYPYTYGIDNQRMEIAEKTNSYWMNIRNANTPNTGERGAVRVGGYFAYEETKQNFNGKTDSKKTVPLNAWTFVCGTFDGSHMRVYIDGQIDSVRPMPYQNIRIEKYNLVVGAKHHQLGDSSFVANFNGKIDDFYLFNRALSDDEIASFYHATTFQHANPQAEPLFSLSPNPSQGIIIINSAKDLWIQVINSTGIIMQTVQLTETTGLNISAYPNGIYWARAFDKEGNSSAQKILLIK